MLLRGAIKLPLRQYKVLNATLMSMAVEVIASQPQIFLLEAGLKHRPQMSLVPTVKRTLPQIFRLKAGLKRWPRMSLGTAVKRLRMVYHTAELSLQPP